MKTIGRYAGEPVVDTLDEQYGIAAYDRNRGHDLDGLESQLFRVWTDRTRRYPRQERARLVALEAWVRLSNTDRQRRAGA